MEKIIYGIIGFNADHNRISEAIKTVYGLSESVLYVIECEGIAVVVGDIEISANTLTRKHALDFARVIEELSHFVTILPIRFGTFLKSDELILQLIEDNYGLFTRNLKKVENKNEFGMKVLWNYEKGIEKIKNASESEQVNSDDYFSKNTVHTTYLFEKIKKHKQDELLLRHVEKLVEEICSHLKSLSPDCVFKKMVTNSLILDVVFLVEKNKKEEFVSAIRLLEEQRPELSFLLTGPWPPYSFVDVRIE